MDDTKDQKLFSEFPPVTTQEWEARIAGDLKGADYTKKLIWKTDEGFDVKPYYRREDLSGLEYLKVPPTVSPFVRGVRSSDNSWIIRQDFDEPDAGKAHDLAIDAISKGAGDIGLNVLETATQDQMSTLLKGIDLSRTGVHFIKSRSYPLSVELLINVLNNGSDNGATVRGSFNFDPLSYLLLHGDFYGSWQQNLDEFEQILSMVKKRLPRFKAITVNGHYFQDGGSNLVQELAFTLASANEYLAGMTDKGFGVDSVAPHIQISMAVGPNYFMEIAKFRAARLLWTRMVEQYKPSMEESLSVFLHARSARWNKTIYDPFVNMLRTTTEGMSAILGNADSVTIDPYDLPFREPSDFSVRIARNQQLVLKEESYLDKIADPSAGSYYIENLTHSLAHQAWNLFLEVENRGGMLKSVMSGFVQEEVLKSQHKKEADIAQRRIILLGTNQYPNLQETILNTIETHPDPLKTGTGSFDRFAEEPAEAPGSIDRPERGQENPETPYLKINRFRAARDFEQLRLETESFVANGHKRPGVFLFTIGNLAMLRARAGFAANFFGCTGYEIIDNPGFSNVGEGVTAALDSRAEVVVICSSDEEYGLYAADIANQIKQIKPELQIIVAGYPKELIENLKQAGIDDFIHIKSNLLETLKKFQRILIKQ